MVSAQHLVVIAAFSFAVGFAVASLAPRIANLLSGRHARRQYVEFVRSTSASSPPEGNRVGWAIHRVLQQQEDDCERLSLRVLPRLGEKAPKCYELMGQALALLDAYASCFWKCSGGDHVLERLVGRSNNQARATLRLMLMGSYDEALVLIRGVGETANLLSLFEAQPDALDRWKSVDERTRRQEFAPVAVRRRLKELGTPIQVTSDTYGELSHRNVHANPSTSPQAYDSRGRSKGSGYFQEAGLMVCENELATALTFLIYAASQLSGLSPQTMHRMLVAGRELIGSVGGLELTNMSEMWSELAKRATP